MVVTHRTPAGTWAVCEAQESCDYRFHFTDQTPAELAAMLYTLLLPLLEIVDPPSQYLPDGTRQWRNSIGLLSRDYDLPARIKPNGDMYWFHHGTAHRAADRPAMVCTDGARAWYLNGRLHRDGGRPAIIAANGRCFYRKNGVGAA